MGATTITVVKDGVESVWVTHGTGLIAWLSERGYELSGFTTEVIEYGYFGGMALLAALL